MRLTVLGKSPSWQDAGGACSGYLIEEGGASVLIDCGNGVFSKLRRYRDYTSLDAVLITHLHADHFLDLVPYAYALTFAPRQQPVPVDRWQGTSHPARPRLIAPRGAGETFRRVAGAWGSEELVEHAFLLEEYEPDSRPEVGPFRVTFREVPHFTETFAVAVEAGDGEGRLVFGADSGPSSSLVDFAREADLFVVEATLPRPERSGERGHMTPEEAGEHGARAGARRLLLTHFSDELDPLWAGREAGRAFGGPVHVAREGDVYRI
jgi:ribonuclease BN (tRNA processing enzyme)